MSCTVTDSAGKQIPGSSVKDGVASATMPAYGSVVVNVTNTATFTRPLKLVKNFEGTADNAAPDNFQATYTLYEVDEDGTETKIGSVKYSDLDDTGSYIFWLETGKTYTIKESFDEGDNNGGTKELPYSGCTAEANDPAESPVGTSDTVYVKLEISDATLKSATNENPVDTITLTNRYSPIEFTVTKVDAASPDIRLANAEFYLSREKEEGKTEYYAYNDTTKLVTWVGEQAEATKLTSDPKQGETYGTFKVYGLPNGQYSLVEVKAPDGYQLPSENFTFTVTDGVVNYVSDNEPATKGTNITVTNTTGTELPETGGMGTTFLTIGGLLMMAAAVGGGCVLRRRRGREGN